MRINQNKSVLRTLHPDYIRSLRADAQQLGLDLNDLRCAYDCCDRKINAELESLVCGILENAVAQVVKGQR